MKKKKGYFIEWINGKKKGKMEKLNFNKPKLPLRVIKNFSEKIHEQTREPGRKIESSLPSGVKTKPKLDIQNLTLTYNFYHDDIGEMGHIKAVFGSEGVSLSKLLCGIKNDDDDFRETRESIMLEIYEIAKAAFAGE